MANGIAAKGEIRNQFHHVIDVVPTLLEAAGIPAPLFVNGIQQAPLEGFSMSYSFDEADAPDTHTTQYFEMFVNRGIYHNGWTAVTRHSLPWIATEMPAFDDDIWELYGPDDWTQAHDLAAQNPEREGSKPPSPCCSPPTRPRMSAPTRRRRSPAT